MRKRIAVITKNALAQWIGLATSLSFTIIGARQLSVADYSELRYVLALLPLLMFFGFPGSDSVVLRETNLRQNISLLTLFRFRITTASIGSALIFIGLFLLHQDINTTLFFFLVVTAILLPLWETATSYRNYLLGRRLTQQGTALLLETRGLTLVLFLSLLGLIYIMHINMLWIYPAWIIATIIPTLIAFFRVTFGKGKSGIYKRPQRGKINFTAIFTTTAALATYTLANSLDKLWLRHELGAEQLARYALLLMMPQELGRLFDSTIPIFYNRLFFEKTKFEFFRLFKLLSFGILPIMAVYTIGFYAFSSLVFGEDYAYPISLVFFSSLFIIGLISESLCVHFLFAHHGENCMFLYSVNNLLFTIIAVATGLWLWGMPGLILSLFIKQTCLPIFFIAFYRKLSHAS